MSNSTNFVLVCATNENKNQLAVLITTLATHYDGKIVIAYSEFLPENIGRLSLSIENTVEYFEFLQETNEQGLLIKSIQKSYDSNTKKMIYLSSNCIVNKPIDELLSVDMGTCIFSGVPEYIYRANKDWENVYRRADPLFEYKQKQYKSSVINTNLLLINMPMVRRSRISIDDMLGRFFTKKYQESGGIDQFINDENVGYNKLELNPKFCHFGDLFLYEHKEYNKSLRVNQIIKSESIISCFAYAKPWVSQLLTRRTMQYPLEIYEPAAKMAMKYIEPSFLTLVANNSAKWEKRLGKLPQAITDYFKSKHGIT